MLKIPASDMTIHLRRENSVMAWLAWGLVIWFVGCMITLPPFILSARISREEEAAERFGERNIFRQQEVPRRCDVTASKRLDSNFSCTLLTIMARDDGPPSLVR